ncbi:MAG: PA-phosphatase-like phosphoesterase [Halothiobacillaceae bacterium]|nr:MAG: PA-phosphatase-like phosphoesterase [Halothiobacillaceae bacterium]
MGGWHIGTHHQRELRHYQPQQTLTTLATDSWQQSQWQQQPAIRLDIKGATAAEPLTLQWAGTIEEIRHTLVQQGWSIPPPLTFTSSLLWLTPHPRPQQLPLLPQVHAESHEQLVMVQYDSAHQKSYVIRLWPSNVVLIPGDTPLWLGYIAPLALHRQVWLSYLQVEPDFTTPLQALSTTLHGWQVERVSRPADERLASLPPSVWDRRLLLITQPTTVHSP